MSRDHAHTDHQGHDHPKITDERRVAIAFGLIALFMLVEVVGGLLSGSLALLADAGHMVSDAVALAMSWMAIRIGKRPADLARSFGYRRLEVLAAFVNGCALFLIAGWVVYEAVDRFKEPVPILGGTMLAVAVAGSLANLAAFWVISGGNRDNLNMRSAWLHILGDLFGSAAAIVAALVIVVTGWSPIDPLLSVLVALIILKSAWGIVKSSSHILLEGVPVGVDLEQLTAELETVLPAGSILHHVHAWSLTADQSLLTLHVSGAVNDPAALLEALQTRLRERYGITHSTIQIEPNDGSLSCNLAQQKAVSGTIP